MSPLWPRPLSESHIHLFELNVATPPSGAIISRDASPSIRNVSNRRSLGRSILEAYNNEILDIASDLFLNLAIKLRLKTTCARDLVNLLAKAERLRNQKADSINDKGVLYSNLVQSTFRAVVEDNGPSCAHRTLVVHTEGHPETPPAFLHLKTIERCWQRLLRFCTSSV
jgi:hypothetical protein